MSQCTGVVAGTLEVLCLCFCFQISAGALCLVFSIFVVLCILRGCRQLREYQKSKDSDQDMNSVLSPFEGKNGTKVGINTGQNDATDDERLLLAEGSSSEHQESSSSDEDFGTHEPNNSRLTREVEET